jgi:hypothetical protein
MTEATTVLKGVLGFDDRPLNKSPAFTATEATALLSPESDDELLLANEADLNAARYRLWTFPPHVDDEEAYSLAGLFPSFVRLIRGQVQNPRLAERPVDDIESDMGHDGRLNVGSDNVVEYGTGRVCLGAARRDPWQGGLWFRLKRWLARLFTW